MDRLDAIAAFVAIADHGSFAAAARLLRVSPQAVTRAIAGLERRLGTRLFHRSTRAVRLTDDGAAYLERCRHALADLEAGERLIRGEADEPHGTLVITAPVMFGRMHVLPVVTQLLSGHSRLSAQLILIDRFVRLVEEGVDVAVRIGALTDSALKARKVGEVGRILVASPDYLRNRSRPATPHDLRDHHVIAFSGISGSDEWRFGAAERMAVQLRPRLIVNSADTAIAAAESGLGITRVLSYQVADQLRNERLVRLLDEFEPAPSPVNLLLAATGPTSTRVRAFVDAAARYFQSQPSTL